MMNGMDGSTGQYHYGSATGSAAAGTHPATAHMYAAAANRDYMAAAACAMPPHYATNPNASSTCVYANKALGLGYSGQPMSVVDHQLAMGTEHHYDSMGLANVNTTPAHLTHHNPVANTLAHFGAAGHQVGCAQGHSPPVQPPPAHQIQHIGQAGSIAGNAGQGGGGKDGKEEPAKLHFPWMKTTKSHAHQWKANWAGEVLSIYCT